MKGAIEACLFLIELFITVGISSYIMRHSKINDDRKNFVLSDIKCYIKNLFTNRNLFGNILGIFVLVLSMPAFLVLILVEIILWIIVFIMTVWDFGTKKGK